MAFDRTITSLALAVLVAALCGTTSSAEPIGQPPADHLNSASPALQKLEDLKREVRVALKELHTRSAWSKEYLETFYARRGYALAWDTRSERAAARVFLERMHDAGDDGLRSAEYDPAAWISRLQRWEHQRRLSGTDNQALFDVQLSELVLRFSADLAYGVGDAASRRQTDIVDLLLEARDTSSARQIFAALEPPHPEYRQLRKALQLYREIEARGGWPSLPEGISILRDAENAGQQSGPRENEDDLRSLQQRQLALRSLASRLAMTGDLQSSGDRDRAEHLERVLQMSYDEALERAVRSFQERHGLAVDGIVGPETIAALNVPVSVRTRQIAANMNRWRHMPEDLGAKYLLVNIAGFRLKAVERGKLIHSMRVVVGKPSSPTPLMDHKIAYLVFRPYWNIPDSITRNELLPQIAEDPEYLHKEQLEIVEGWQPSAPVVASTDIDWATAIDEFPYRLRQKPGAHNALGLVKFMFPNDANVYLHDTPSVAGFEPRRRAFSHGCVRVEDPITLAEFLLRPDSAWTRDSVTAALQGDKPQAVRVPDAVPIYLTYFTAWVEGANEVHFRTDLYGLDDRGSEQPGLM
jgi:murein L,D-transpeptidase YcbB/YkuD